MTTTGPDIDEADGAARADAPDLDAVRSAVAAVPDPEMAGVGIGDLGLVHTLRSGPTPGSVTVELIPTFLGCPALDIIRTDVAAAARSVPGVDEVTVEFVATPAWSTDRITEAGHAALAELGIAVAATPHDPRVPTPITLGRTHENRRQVPGRSTSTDAGVSCPHCGSTKSVRLLSTFGPTSCRSSAWCDDCRNAIEIMRA